MRYSRAHAIATFASLCALPACGVRGAIAVGSKNFTESIVIAEHRRKQALNERYGALSRYRIREQGDAALSFFSRSRSDESLS